MTEIQTPLLVMGAKDDVVTRTDRIPIDDLKRRPNVVMAIYERGGHCDFFMKKQSRKRNESYHKEFMPIPTFAFF